MIEVAGIKFQKDYKIYYYDINNLELKHGDCCIVEIDRGIDLAKVIQMPKIIEKAKGSKPLPKVIRLATREDWNKVRENRAKGKAAFLFCKQKIKEQELSMKLVTTHYTIDGKKIIFYFTAEERVDFRQLVKDLVHHLKIRIELRQIGVRDEAKLCGGCGWCGRELCCGTFLKEFDSVQIKMAKEQNLILTPGKISGVCGRLMCCLAYEYPIYAKFRKQAPRCGTKVTTPKGIGTVQGIDVMREQIIVKLEGDAGSLSFPLKEVHSFSLVKGGKE
ncbi:MAG: stage 0 sporulation family protein [bacterium]